MEEIVGPKKIKELGLIYSNFFDEDEVHIILYEYGEFKKLQKWYDDYMVKLFVSGVNVNKELIFLTRFSEAQEEVKLEYYRMVKTHTEGE